MLDFAEIRDREYDWSGDLLYWNAASWGPIPERSRIAAVDFERRRQRGQLIDDDLIEVQVRARRALAGLVNAGVADIALMPNTSAGLNVAAHCALQRARPERRTIVLSDREFPANVYPWLALRRHGLEVHRVTTRGDGNPDEDALEQALQRDDVVAFSYSFVQFATGFRGDLDRFSRICRERDILFVVDAIQGLGAVPLDVQACPVDLLAAGGQKWLCSPWGTGFLYVRPELTTELEPYLPGWLAYQANRDFGRLVDYDQVLRTDAQRFEVGSQPFQACIALASSVELLLELGVDCILRHNHSLQDQIIAWARARGNVQIVSDLSARSGILCVRPQDADAAHTALRAAHVTCALREGALRLSPHFYNNAAEVEQLLAVLDRTV